MECLSWTIAIRLSTSYLKFRVCWEKMFRCEKSILIWKIQYPPLLLREQCIDRERSEDTLPNLLRNVNRSASARVFPHSCYKLSTGWGKAGPALRCNSKGGYGCSSIKIFLAAETFSPQQLQISYLDYPLFIFIEKCCLKFVCHNGSI